MVPRTRAGTRQDQKDRAGDSPGSREGLEDHSEHPGLSHAPHCMQPSPGQQQLVSSGTRLASSLLPLRSSGGGCCAQHPAPLLQNSSSNQVLNPALFPEAEEDEDGHGLSL